MQQVLTSLRRKVLFLSIKALLIYWLISLILNLIGSAYTLHVFYHLSHIPEELLSEQVQQYFYLLGVIVFLSVVAFFVCALFYDKLALTITKPLKEITEVLKSNPSLHQPLDLPAPTNFEMKTLIREMQFLWKRLSEMDKKNIEMLHSKKQELDILFGSMEDAVLILDSENKVSHHNENFKIFLAIGQKEIMEENWEDLSLTNKTYIDFRSYLRHLGEEEGEFVALVEKKKHIFRVRMRNIHGKQKENLGKLILLHDITEKLSEERYLDKLKQLEPLQNFTDVE